MLPYLIYLASCGFSAQLAQPSDPSKALFHFKSGYDFSGSANLQFTYNNEGFYIALKFYDKNDKPSDLMFLTANAPSVTSPFDSFTVTGKTRNSDDNKYLYAEFEVTNNENFPRKIDLGAYAKLATTYGSKNVNMPVKVRTFNGIGLKCTGKTKPDSGTDFIVSIIGKNTDYPDVTGYHFGKHEFSENDPTKFPYWDSDHSGSEVKTGDPIGISLHWSKKEIPGGETVVLGFVITGDDFANFKPMVKDITEKKRYYSQGDKATIKIEGTNYEIEQITVFLKLPKITEPIKQECSVSESSPKCTLTHEITIPNDADSYEYTYWVKDSNLQESSHEKSKLPMSTPPKLTITKEPTGEYNLLDDIDIAGTISDDESRVYIKYQFDNGRINEITKTDVTEDGISFDVKIPIPKDIKPGNDRKLSIWLVDDDGVSIEPQTFTITVKPPTKPEIKSAFVGSKNRFHNGIPYGAPGDKVVLFGVATDKEANKELSLNVKFGDNQPVSFKIPVTEEPEPFAVYYTIPQIGYKIYDVEFEAVDFTGEHSEKKLVKFEVRDPTLPPPTPSPRPAKFVKSEPTSEEACFDLKYREENKADQSLTYKDEGFFVAYRIYNDIATRVLNTTYIKKSDNLDSTTGDIHVKVSIEDEPLFENYTRLVFNVTNNGYFNKIIDLGVFADSMFANDDNNPISRRGDKLGFVISGSDLYYTVFTNQFLTNIPVSGSYVGAVKRTNGKIENMPIFENSGSSTETSSDQNSAYAFSWTYQVIKAETSMIFAVTLAPDKFIPTPSIIEDQTDFPYGKDDVQPGEEIEFTFKISDADINQLINVTFEANGQTIKRQFTPTLQKPFFYFTETITMPENDDYTYTYSIYATDASGSWASNKITDTLILLRDYEPNMEENLTPKRKYVEGSKVHITGQLWTYKVPSHIRWQWNGNSKIETSTQQFEPNADDEASNYDIEIPIPKVFKIGEEITLNYWVENSVGQKSSSDLEYLFTVGTKPVLSEVGFSVESASVNDQVVAYVLMSDKEVDRWLKLYYKFDDFDLVTSPIKRFKSNDSETPYGFFFTVPRVDKGQHTFSFVVRDEDDFDSEPYSVKLYVA